MAKKCNLRYKPLQLFNNCHYFIGQYKLTNILFLTFISNATSVLKLFVCYLK